MEFVVWWYRTTKTVDRRWLHVLRTTSKPDFDEVKLCLWGLESTGSLPGWTWGWHRRDISCRTSWRTCWKATTWNSCWKVSAVTTEVWCSSMISLRPNGYNILAQQCATLLHQIPVGGGGELFPQIRMGGVTLSAWEPDPVPERHTILLPCSRQNCENRYACSRLKNVRHSWPSNRKQRVSVNMQQDLSRNSNNVRLQCDSGSKRVTPTVFQSRNGKEYTLFQTEMLICRPCSRLREAKTVPCWVAHPHITHMGVTPPSPWAWAALCMLIGW